MSSGTAAASTTFKTDKEILGYSRWVVFVAAFLAMSVISPYEYAWSSMAGHIGGIYHWSSTQIGWMFTLFVVFESIGTLPGGILRDKFGPRWVTIIAGLVGGVGIYATALGPNYTFVLILWCIGSLFAGFIYNTAVTVANTWFPDKRGVVAGLMAGAFSWGSLPFIFPIQAIPKTAPDSTFFGVIYIMAVIIGGVSIVAAFFIKDPPIGWKPAGWTPKVKVARPSDHQYTLGQAASTWQFWLLVVSFILISSAGLAGVSQIVAYAGSFKFTALAGTLAASGITISNGVGRVVLGGISERIGRESAAIWTYILTAVFLFLTVIAGVAHSEALFVITAVVAIFFWGPLFTLFPAMIGQYYGSLAAGSNYGLLYAIAKGSGGVYGGVLTAILVKQAGFPVAMSVSAILAIVAGLLIIPLKSNPPVWKGETPKGEVFKMA